MPGSAEPHDQETFVTNLIPQSPQPNPNYWCTWGAQNFSLAFESALQFARDGFSLAVQNLDEAKLFGPSGWAVHPAFDRIRGDLIIMLDVGWDLPLETWYSGEGWRLGTLEADPKRFPSCVGTPSERLAALHELAQNHGWGGVGLWVAPQVPGEGRSESNVPEPALVEAHWRERLRWTRDAGIGYWKVDIGVHTRDATYRSMMSRLALEEAPGLLLEHGANCSPLNAEPAPWDPEFEGPSGERFNEWGSVEQRFLDFTSFSGVLRTYDVTPPLSVPTTLDRVSGVLTGSHMQPGYAGHVNAEDEVYLAAALGCAFGVMRHPVWRSYDGLNPDPFRTRERMDEVVRAVRWQRLAPPYGLSEGGVTSVEGRLRDEWFFEPGDTWADWVVGSSRAQSAPARVARGLPLPEVFALDDEQPYVVASRHPNGAVSVATLPRVHHRTQHTPPVQVTLDLTTLEVPLGVFGEFNSLKLRLSEPLGTRRILAQDLAGDEARDITDLCPIQANFLTVPGSVLREVGLEASTPGDVSEPGLVLAFR